MIFSIKSYYNWLFIALHSALAGLHQNSLLIDVPPRMKKTNLMLTNCSGIARPQPEQVREQVSAWSRLSLHPSTQSSLSVSAVLPGARMQSESEPPSLPFFLLLVLQSLNWRGLCSSAHPFLQAVAGRGELVPLSLISCSMVLCYHLCLLYTNLGEELVADFLPSASRKATMCYNLFCRCFYSSGAPWNQAIGITENM